MADHAKDHHAEHSSLRYWLAFAALFVFTCLTYGLHHVNLGEAALPIAMMIAFTKAMVVVLFFMHLYDHPGVNRMIIAVTLLLLGFGMIMLYADSVTRFPLSAPHF